MIFLRNKQNKLDPANRLWSFEFPSFFEAAIPIIRSKHSSGFLDLRKGWGIHGEIQPLT